MQKELSHGKYAKKYYQIVTGGAKNGILPEGEIRKEFALQFATPREDRRVTGNAQLPEKT